MIHKYQACLAGLLLPGVCLAAEPYEKPDDSWISLNGTVTSTSPDSFQLDYGKGMITVEMDDWDFDADGYKLIDGDKVTVYGYVDDDLYETRTIEAGSVYVKNLSTYFYASSADEEDTILDYEVVALPGADGDVSLTGVVESTSGREFTIDTGLSEVRVDTDEMPYNPMDDEGYQKIQVGERVRVTGEFGGDLFEARELDADTVITLRDSSREEG